MWTALPKLRLKFNCLENFGFKSGKGHEGALRNILIPQEWVNWCQCALLRKEWAPPEFAFSVSRILTCPSRGMTQQDARAILSAFPASKAGSQVKSLFFINYLASVFYYCSTKQTKHQVFLQQPHCAPVNFTSKTSLVDQEHTLGREGFDGFF